MDSTHWVRTLAVLITCHNRKDNTLSCLERLDNQELPKDVKLKIYLVDDGSTDGTSEAVSKKFPDVNLIQGDGNLFWNGGMRMAWEAAMNHGYDYYLWLNDDTFLVPGAISQLLINERELQKRLNMPVILVGAMIDPDTARVTYGGMKRISKNIKALRFSLMPLSDMPAPCDTINGNCVLVPYLITERIGVMSEDFTHGLGDFDYGLRAIEAGYTCWVAPGFLGTCSRNPSENTWYDPEVSIQERNKKLHNPTGNPPNEWLKFVRRHGGNVWIIVWVKFKLRFWFPGLWHKLRQLRGRSV